MDEINEKQSYSSMLERFQSARDRMSLGYQTLKEENSFNQLQGRMRNRLRAWGLGFIDQESAFDRYEQMALSRGDKMASSLQHGADIGFGGAQLGMNAMEFMGVGATKAGSRLGMASLGAGVAGYGGMAAKLGRMATFTNPYLIAGQIALSLGQGGFQHSISDPFTNTRMFESSVFGGMRNVLGGTQSNRGFGGMDMSSSLGFAKQMQGGVAWGNKGISSDMINNFVKAAAEMPQLQYVQNTDQAIQGMSKFVDIMVKMSKQFKGKEQEIMQAFQQFGQMGMSLGQSQQAFTYANKMGSFLNVSPNNITMAGANAVQQMMNSGQLGGIAQGTVYASGSQNYAQVERMRQSGSISSTQLQNFGGTQGVANTITNSQMNFLKSGSANLFLKAIYDPSTNGINKEMLDKMVTGQYSLGDARRKAMEVTLNPKANMDFAMQKDFIIGKLGADINQFTYGAWDKQFANKSPFGRDLTGRAKWLQHYQGMDEQTAMLNAQSWISNNPHLERYTQKLQEEQNLLSNDPYFSSRSNFGVGVNTFSRDLKRAWDVGVKQNSPFAVFNAGSKPYEQFWGGIGGTISTALGVGGVNDLYQNMTTTKALEDFKPFSKIEGPKDLSTIMTKMRTEKEFGSSVWRSGVNQVKNRDLAVMLASENIADLATNPQDRKSLLATQKDVEKKLLGTNFSTIGDDIYSGLFGSGNNISAGDAQEKLAERFKKMSDADVFKEASNFKEKYLIEKGMGEMVDGKFVEKYAVDLQNGMTGSQGANVMSSYLKTVLPEERVKSILKGMEKVDGMTDLSYKSPYKSFERKGSIWNTIGSIAGLMTPITSTSIIGDALTQNFRRGGTRDQEAIQGFGLKYETADLEGKSNMYQTLKDMKKMGSEDQWSDKMYSITGLNKNADIKDVENMLNEFGDASVEGSKAWMLDKSNMSDKKLDARKKARDIEKGVSVAKGLYGLYGSESYKNLAKSYGAEGDFLANLMGKTYGGDQSLSTRISQSDFIKMKKGLKNTPGLGEIFRDEFMEYDEKTGSASFKDVSKMSSSQKRRFEKAQERWSANISGKLEEMKLQTSEQIWNNRGESAKTIQDFAVAVAKGLSMYHNNSTDLTSYLHVQSDKDKDQATKKEGKS
jgi:hypothetical protein